MTAFETSASKRISKKIALLKSALVVLLFGRLAARSSVITAISQVMAGVFAAADEQPNWRGLRA